MFDPKEWTTTAPKRIETLLAMTRAPQTSRELQDKGISAGDINYYVGRVDRVKRNTADKKALLGIEGYKHVSFIGEGIADIDSEETPATFWLTAKGLEYQDELKAIL